MAYDEELADRVREIVSPMGKAGEIRMFGGLCFTLNGNMLVSVLKDDLMVRVGPDKHDSALEMKGARVMDFTKRPMIGYVYVDRSGTRDTRSLAKWVRMAARFVSTLPTKSAKSAKKTRTARPT